MKRVLILFIVNSLLISCGVTTNTNNNSNNSNNDGETISKRKFGLSVIDLNESHRGLTDLSHGVIIETVYAGLSANAAGLLKGDIIVTLGKHNILNIDGFYTLLNNNYKYEYGQIDMSIVRNGQLQKFRLYLN